MRILIITFAFLLLAACGPSISKNAVAQRANTGCQLVIEGQFPNMVHTLRQMFFPGSSKITARFYVPALSGKYRADQIRVTFEGETGEPWNVGNLSGEISFLDEQVTIELLQKRTETEPIKPILFNGRYTVVNRSGCA